MSDSLEDSLNIDPIPGNEDDIKEKITLKSVTI